MSSILDELKNKYPNEESVQKANNIAEGVAAMPVGGSGGGSLVVHTGYDETLESNVLDKTWQEIHDAFPNVIAVSGQGDFNSSLTSSFIFSADFDDRHMSYAVRLYDYDHNTKIVYESNSPDGVLVLKINDADNQEQY